MTCDTANRVKSISAGGSTIVSDVIYHPSGQPAVVSHGNGTIATSDYDDRGRTNSVTVPGVMALLYGQDGANNVVSFEDAVVPGSRRTMGYDRLDRLISAIEPAGWGTIAYDYDKLGNRTLKSGSVTTTYEYDSRNLLATASGPETYRSMTFTWDVPGRLASSSDGATYGYDARGRRVRKTEAGQTTLYHYDAAGRVIAESAAEGAKLRDYLYLGNKLVAVDGCIESAPPSCSDRQWYHTDTLGSVVARTSAVGTATARFDYQPWGEQWAMSGTSGDRQYNGRVYDPGTGFHDYGARMYWPQIGRFISADTYGGDPANPASLNRYGYVHNNPYKYTDPSGNVAFLVPAAYVAAAEFSLWCAAGGCQRAANTLSALLDLLDKAEAVQQSQVAPSGQPAPASPTGQKTEQPNDPKKPKLVSNPKHQPNSKSPEPSNAAELYSRSIEDAEGVRWAKDEGGTIHRFSKPSNGETIGTAQPPGIHLLDKTTFPRM